MDKNTKNVLFGVGILTTGIAVGMLISRLLDLADMLFAKYGLGDWDEEECECCNGDGNCHCETECACDSEDVT